MTAASYACPSIELECESPEPERVALAWRAYFTAYPSDKKIPMRREGESDAERADRQAHDAAWETWKRAVWPFAVGDTCARPMDSTCLKTPPPVYADGGYPFVYYARDTRGRLDCDELCSVCAGRVRDEDGATLVESVYYEGPSVFCAECRKEIASAYGDCSENERESDERNGDES